MKHARRLALLMALMLLFTMIPAAYAEEAGQEEGVAMPMIEEELSPDEAAATAGAEMEPFVPEAMVQKAIIGMDNRTTVANPTVYPYSAIAYLKVTHQCGCKWEGTGFMVGPDAMLTSGDMIICSEHGQALQSLTAYFGYTSETNYLYKFAGSFTYFYSSNYNYNDYTPDNLARNYSFIKLKERVGDTVGWFGMSAKSDDALNLSAFELAGYRDGVLKTGWGVSSVEDDYLITYTNDTMDGNSGCPVFTDDYYVVAINVAESTDASANWGRRITSSLIKSMRDNDVID